MNLIKHGGLEGDGGLVVLLSIVIIVPLYFIIESKIRQYFSDDAVTDREYKRLLKKEKE